MPPAFEPPSEFDDYVILAPLGVGQGRMGQVFLAEDTVLARHVAVKFVDAAPDLAARQRFLLEVRTAARVQHPNVVTIHRVGELGDRPYLVTEFVRGKNLAELERPVAWRRALEIGIDLARGLAAAHRQGVVHCDIKPANVMVTDEGAAKLVDFGLATLVVDGPGPEAVAASPRGTPDFMAPEVWDLAPQTRRSDVYSLGAVLYDLVAGHPPHAAVAASELSRVARQVDAPPLVEAAPSADARFATIVDLCLARDPRERFASGEELRQALERLERASDGAAVPVGNPYRGLHAFDAEQRGLFFGRGIEIAAIIDRLRVESFVLVTGDSGVGKSSICRAGVVPAVLDTPIASGRMWSVARLVPGRHPLAALGEALAAALGAEVDVRGNVAGLGRALARLLGASRGLLVFVDQLEELVTVSDPAEAALAEQALAGLADGGGGVRLLASLRADFLSRFAALPWLGQDLSRALYFVRPLPPERLRDVIVGPAQAVGARFENEDMVDELVRATAAAEGGLPLLSFALAELWTARDVERGVIPAAALEAMGGVGGALARHADETVAALPPDERQAARRLLTRLVTRAGTRVRRAEAELATSPAEQAALAQLVRGRLLVAHDSDDGSAYELAHEVLLEGWGTLRRWLSENAAGRALRERVTNAAEDWNRHGRLSDALWRGGRLAEAEALEEAELAPRERDFLRASYRAARRARLRRIAVVVGMVALLVGVYAGIKVQAQRAVDAEVATLRDAASRLSGAAETQNARSAELAAAAFERFDAADRITGELLWAQALASRAQVETQFARASRFIEAALAKDADREDTSALLADMLYARAVVAESTGQRDRVDELVERFSLYDHDGSRRRRWDAPGHLELDSSPRGATITVDGGRASGVTPNVVKLARGLHTLVVALPGRSPARVIVLARRGETQATAVALLPPGAVPPGFDDSPAGRFLCGSGGDEEARRGFFDAAPLHPRATAGYLIARTEVTYGEYLAYVETLPAFAQGQHLPGVAAKFGAGAVELRRGRTGWDLTLQPLGRPYTAAWGQPLVYSGRATAASHDWRSLPVTGVSVEDAEGYAAWLRASARVPGARLCTELEWERAARGADDRIYPGGNALDAGDANFDETHGREQMGPDTVHSHPRSDSPFGIADMSGNAFEWTTSAFAPGQYVGRGGSYFHDRKTIQIVNRTVSAPAIRDATLGIRMCAEVSAAR